MGYINNHIGYPKDLLSSRAIIKKDNYAVIPQEGLVRNVIPGFENCDTTVLSSPRLGATFVDYIVTLHESGHTSKGFGGDGVETFIYVIDGHIKASAAQESFDLTTGGYLYCPADQQMNFENAQKAHSRLFVYKRRYIPIEGHNAHVVSGNVNSLENINYEDMTNVHLKDLLPKTLGFDMNIHILSFEPGASHGYIETHLQEHGALLLSGQGMYNLDNDWVMVKKDDYIFMGAYCLQACYAVGQEPLSYIYSKDCNRDIEI